MQVVFLNTFEKSGQDSRTEQAQLSICEQNGLWSIIWTESLGEKQDSQSVWFEGSSWEEMMMAFRHGIAVQMGEGFQPIIDGMLEERRSHEGQGSQYSMIQYYGEMNAESVLFEALREWRRSKAAEMKKSAYLIASNRMLCLLSTYVPHKPEELLQIPGWGETKQAAYAEEVLAITSSFDRERGFPLDWVSSALDPKAYMKWIYKQKENKFKSQMDRQQEKRKLLSAIAEGKSFEELLAQSNLPRRDLIERIEQLETEGYDMEPLIEKELESMPESEQQLVWDALLAVGDRYLKPVLRRAYGDEAMQEKGKSLDLMYDRLRLIRLRYRRMNINHVS
ncbi:HRDC domain-containing protein [Paenibacillus montanisoli]|uniref:Aldolase n=1 Tax=Paenibacillus montanisoli TaxID=2081970 RepID=A0A328UBG0_9BACL|nr:HRDC domain-containing protein [Paenibacillus montanisoli]RAP77376.1 aldolase [Paenibacillus montanisoli]